MVLGVVIQDNLSPEKHIDRIFCDTFKMLRNIHMAFHFLDEKNYNYNNQTKTGICRNNIVPVQEKTCVEIRKNTQIANKMVPDLEDLTYQEISKEMHLIALKEREERRYLITIYKLMNNLQETDKKDIILRRNGEAR